MREKADGDLLAAFKRHLIDQALSPTTIVNYLSDVRAFAFWYTRENGTLCAPLSLDVGHIRDHRDYLQTVEGRAPSTINRRLQALRKFCRFSCQAGWLDSNPAAQVCLLSELNRFSPRTLSPDGLSVSCWPFSWQRNSLRRGGEGQENVGSSGIGPFCRCSFVWVSR